MISRRHLLLSFAGSTFLLAQPKPFVPADFVVPEKYTAPQGKYQLRPLGPAYAEHDYKAYMSSIAHLQQTFTYSTSWPHEKITMAEAIKDVEGELASFQARRKFTYAVLNPQGTEELGCVYISPSPKAGYDAQVRMWVTKAQFDLGLEKVLYADMKKWLQAKWPFAKVAFIGQELSRADYNALPNKPKN